MVSRFRYSHVANQWVRGQKSRLQVIQAVFTLAVIYTLREFALPVIFCYFALSAPLRSAWRKVVNGQLFKSREVSRQQ